MNITNQKVKELKEIANRIRINAIEMAMKTKGRGAHLSTSFSCVEIVTSLYFGIMNYCNTKTADINRDRFICSKTHAVLATYPVLHELGLISAQELLDYRQDGSELYGYPRNLDFGLEFEGGSLGMGLSYGVGQALAARIKNLDYRVFVLLGDGELNEGSVWEGFMAAAHYHLDNITAIIDRNRLSLDGDTENVMALESLEAKLVSFGWHVLSCNGHDFKELFAALSQRSDQKPTAIIANTIKGKGVLFMEGQREWHQARLNKDQYENAISELRGVENDN